MTLCWWLLLCLFDYWKWRHSSIKISGTTHQMGASHPRKLDSPSDSVSIIIRYPSRRHTGPTHTLFTVSASTVQHIYCFHQHTVCQTYIKKYSEVNGICFQHQVYRTCCILTGRGFHCWSVTVWMVTPWHHFRMLYQQKKIMVHDKWIATTVYCWNLCGVTEETTINQVCSG